MTEKNRNLMLRIASALVALPIALYLLGRGGLPMGLFVSLAVGVVVFEFYSMSLGRLDAPQVLGIGAAAALPIALTVSARHFPTLVLVGIGTLVVVFLSYHLLRGTEGGVARTSLLIFGILYGGLLLSTVCGVRQFPDGVGWLVLTLATTWLNDTGAYAFGRMFGKHKMAPAVSPSKTWEGFFGGMATSVAGAFAVRFVYFPGLRLADCLVVPLVVSVLGPLGDLCESMIKRAYGVKDSGKIMPGHGGLLDRVDALLFTAPFIYFYVLLIRDLL